MHEVYYNIIIHLPQTPSTFFSFCNSFLEIDNTMLNPVVFLAKALSTFTKLFCERSLKILARFQNDGETWANIFNETVGYKQMTMRDQFEDVLTECVWSKIRPLEFSCLEEKTLPSGDKVKKVIFRSKLEMDAFCSKFDGGIKLVAVDEARNSAVFVCPYGHIFQSFDNKSFSKKYQKLYRAKKMEPVFVRCEVDVNFRHARRSIYLNQVKVFIREIRHLIWKGETIILYHVVVPDALKAPVELGDGVSVRGSQGWVPKEVISTQAAHNPMLYTRFKANGVGNLVFAVHPHHSIKDVLQWRVSAIQPVPPPAVIVPAGFDACPEGFSVLTTIPSSDAVNGGGLIGADILFKVNLTTWMHAIPVEYVPPQKRKRDPSQCFQYMVQFKEDGSYLFIYFFINKYGVEMQPGHWVLLRAM